MYLREIVMQGAVWIYVAQDRDALRTVVGAVMDLTFP
jgi:hypothetical protein